MGGVLFGNIDNHLNLDVTKDQQVGIEAGSSAKDYPSLEVYSYSPQVLGVQPSADIIEFRADVWFDLAAAVLVAAISMELVAFTLTSRWSNLSLGLLAIAGFASIIVTFIANQQARHYWSFVGILLPVGEALWKKSEEMVGEKF